MSRSIQGRMAAGSNASPKEIHDSLLAKAHNYYLDMEKARSPTSLDNPINVFSGNYGPRSLLKGGSSVRSRSMRREIVPERNKDQRFNEVATRASVRSSNAAAPRRPHHLPSKASRIGSPPPTEAAQQAIPPISKQRRSVTKGDDELSVASSMHSRARSVRHDEISNGRMARKAKQARDAKAEKDASAKKKQKLIEAIQRMDEEKLEELGDHLHLDERVEGEEQEGEEGGEEDKKGDERLHDEIDSLYYGGSVRSGVSRRTGTSINSALLQDLEKQLLEERRARLRLEKELDEGKRVRR